MKRLLITLLTIVIAVPLILGGVLGYSYYTTGEDRVPTLTLGVLEKNVAAAGYEWNEPIFSGMIYKEFFRSPSNEAENIGLLADPQLSLTPPAGYVSSAELFQNGTSVWGGLPEDIGNYSFKETGDYMLQVKSEKLPENKKGYGTFYFRVSFSVKIEPQMEASAESVKQGDVLAIRVYNLFDGTVPTVDTGFEMTGDVIFLPHGEGEMIAYVPVTHNRENGAYTITVTAGDTQWQIPLQVIAVNFGEQHMTIDLTDPEITEANSAAAYQQYRDKIYPLFETADSTQYWKGTFITPTEGPLSTTYALTRYTNGVAGSPHPAIDIRADEGAPVVAPNAGKVVLAEYLMNTGNTIVIEHGGGLKSYFYHMSQLDVEAGQMVEKGQSLGAVGSTGYSTGPHMHYEVRIGNQSVNPTQLINGESGIYAFEKKN